MLTRQEEVARLEEDAKELVSNLRALHERIGSYQTAKDELGKTNSVLLSLVGETQTLSKQSHAIIGAVREIVKGGIFDRLESLEDTNTTLLSLVEQTRTLSKESHAMIGAVREIIKGGIFDRLESLEDTNTTLLSLVEETQKLSKESHAIIGAISEMVKGSILERLESLGKRAKRSFVTIAVGLSAIVVVQILILVLK